MATNVTLPELGENIESGSVAKVLVSVGDTVEKDQALIEVETEKAVVEVPSTVAGSVKKIAAKEGADLKVGDLIAVIEEGAAGDKSGEADAEEASDDEAGAESESSKKTKSKKEEPEDEAEEESPDEEASKDAEETEEESEEAPEEESEEGPKKKKAAKPAEKPKAEPKAAPAAKKASEKAAEKEPAAEHEKKAGRGPVAASPAVRRLAREIGVDISQVKPSDPTGRVTSEDIKTHARQASTHAAGEPVRAALIAAGPLPDFTRWGGVRREKMQTIRRRTAERLALAWTTIPHVTQHDMADITELEAFRKEYGAQAEQAGGKLTTTAILVKMLAFALKRFPQFNASIDAEAEEIVYKEYYNVGVAVDTERGLLVPVIKNADEKNLVDIAIELGELSERARTRKATLEDMQGSSMTITNLGSIGGVAFTPIINPPEVAILGVSRARMEPVYKDGSFVPRMMLPLSLSYDHRLIDGADAIRFTRWLCTALEKPLLLFLDE